MAPKMEQKGSPIMAKTKIIRNTIIVESGFTYEQIEKLKKFSPEALHLTDKDGNVLFTADLADKGAGSISKYGICYGKQADKTKKAAVTMTAPDDVKDVKQWFMDTVGVKMLKIHEVEAQYEAALATVDANIKAVQDGITVEG